MVFRRQTIFDIIKEAEDDEQSDVGTEEIDNADNQAPSPEESDADADNGEDENFDIDANLDIDGGDESGADDGGDLSDDSGSDGSSDLGDGESDAEVIPANTNIFSTLTAEEQKVKIKELQNQFNTLYNNTDDILSRINLLSEEEYSQDIIKRMCTSLYELRQYIKDYLMFHFDNKSFVENDIMLNKFLAILNSISEVVKEVSKFKDKDENSK